MPACSRSTGCPVTLLAALLKGQETGRVAPAVADTTAERESAHLVLPPAAAVEGETRAVAERAPTILVSPSGAFCARCGEPVSAKVRDYCLAHPKRFAGLVYCYRDQRAVKPRGTSR